MREKWIDCSKGIAVIAVVIDHLYGMLYVQREVQYATFFSVTLFVFLGGVNTYHSCKRHLHESYLSDITRRLFHILFPYAIATGLYQFQEDKFWDLGKFFNSLISFSGINLFYFLVFYIQLVIVSRFMYYVVISATEMKYPIIGYIGLVGSSIMIAFFLQHYTNIPLQGGQALFGGSYLVVFICGMLFSKYRENIRPGNANILECILWAILVGCVYIFMLYDNFTIDKILELSTINPPGITIGLYTICVMSFLVSLCAIIEKRQGLSKYIYNIICQCGRYSYYVYLFHMLFILVLLHKVLEVYEINIWVSRIGVITIAIGGSMIIGIVIEKLMLFMKGYYNAEKI